MKAAIRDGALLFEGTDIAANALRSPYTALIGSGTFWERTGNRFDRWASSDERMGWSRTAVLGERREYAADGNTRNNVSRSKVKAKDTGVTASTDQVKIIGNYGATSALPCSKLNTSWSVLALLPEMRFRLRESWWQCRRHLHLLLYCR